MLGDCKAFSGYSVSDIAAAQKFYSETLGLHVEQMPQGLTIVLASGGSVFLYPKPDHVPASFTVLNFLVEDIDATVVALKAKGVTFEHYDGPMVKTDENGIAHPPETGQGPTIAWFNDPAENILAVLEDNNPST